LNAIVGFSHIVAQGMQPENNEEFCQIIESNNKLLLQLISDIIDLSQIEADQMEFESKEFDICKMISDAWALYSANLSDKVEMICDLPDKSLIIKSDPKRLNQVLTNILDNAVKHTHKGYITIGYFSEANDIRFFVRDTGEGIAEDNLSHVFDRFAKFDAFAQGTGLGLSLCQSIIKKFGGEIGVKSELGKGSEFWFTLPASEPISVAS
jgi:signal transduction histidine kinase